MIKYLLLLLVLLGACATTPPPAWPVYTEAAPPEHPMPDIQQVLIDADFTPPHKQAIRAAVDSWNIALNGYRKYVIEDEDYRLEVGPLKRIVDTHQGVIILSLQRAHVKGLPGGVLAFVKMGLPVIHVIEDAIGSRDLAAIVMHEFAHIMGTDHLEIPGVLINPSYSRGNLCIDWLTVQAVAEVNRHRGWDPNHMRHCR
jgi:hypothetical protein